MRNLLLLTALLCILTVAKGAPRRGVRGRVRSRRVLKKGDGTKSRSADNLDTLPAFDSSDEEEGKKGGDDGPVQAEEAKGEDNKGEAPALAEEAKKEDEEGGKGADTADEIVVEDAMATEDVDVTLAGEQSTPLEKINISIQPVFDGIPVYLGLELGLYEAVGLDPNVSIWTSGGPQVEAAVEDEAWDFGVAGSIPNIIAASQGISTVGISNDESSANQLVGAPGVTEFPPAGELSAGAFAVTPGSTADLMLRRCMEANGVAFDDSHFLGADPDDIVTALESGNSTYGALWSPNSHVYLDDNADAQEFCNGEAVGVTIPGGLMIRDEWGQDNPDLAAKALAVYLHGVTLMQNIAIRDKILEHSRGFYDWVGLNPSDETIERDLLTRPIFNLDALLGLMSRNFVNDFVSTADYIYNDLATFLVDQGTIAEVPPADSYLNDEYLQMISVDPELRYFASAGYGAMMMSDEVGVVVSKAGPERKKKA